MEAKKNQPKPLSKTLEAQLEALPLEQFVHVAAIYRRRVRCAQMAKVEAASPDVLRQTDEAFAGFYTALDRMDGRKAGIIREIIGAK